MKKKKTTRTRKPPVNKPTSAGNAAYASPSGTSRAGTSKPTTAKPRAGAQAPPDAFQMMGDPRSMESHTAAISRLLAGQEFGSLDEANAFLQNLMSGGQIPAMPSESPLDRAQDRMYQAWEANGRRRLKLAREALAISPDCADAYVLLAEEAAADVDEAKAYYAQGVEAGERALGPRAFEEDAGHFWGLMQTRPYMRARAGLASCLWLQGQHDEAIHHYQEMLRLNPNDNQGLRYLLVECLMIVGRDGELGQLLEQFDDDGAAAWLYTRALWLYRVEGATAKAAQALREALEQNPFVPQFLQGRKHLPREAPAYIGFGDENEAVEYLLRALPLWLITPGALDWLADVLSSGPAASSSKRVH